MPLDDIIFEINQRDLLGFVLLLAFLFVPIGISQFLYKGDPAKPPLFDRLQARMGLGSINSGLLFVAIALWTIIFASLVMGLLGVVWSFIMSATPQSSEQTWDWRFSLAKMAALTATLGAVVALPFTLIRLTFTRTQTETAVEALFNDKINAAVEDLHAQRQVSVKVTDGETKTHETVWQDDVTRRNGAIDRLEGLAGEEPKAAPRIARMLSVYVRELSREHPPKTVPTSDERTVLQNWVRALTPARSDMQNAMQVLGRLKETTGLPLDSGEIDLTEANMQGCDLAGLNFSGAKMKGVQLQGANLGEAQLQGAYLSRAQLQGAALWGAQLQGAKLGWARLQGAYLNGAQLQGADLSGAQLQRADLGQAQLQGAYLSGARLQGAYLNGAQLQGADLSGAWLHGANLVEAELNGANFDWVKLHGADISEATLDALTSFNGASIKGSALKGVDFTDSTIKVRLLNSAFGDATTIIPSGHGPDHENWPERWSKEELDWEEFNIQHRDFQRSIGQDPDNPA